MTRAKVLLKVVSAALLSACCGLTGCKSVSGYPTNPFDSDRDLAAFVGSSGAGAIQAYYATPDPILRESMRNQIVYSRLAAYDIEYQNFQADILRESNLSNLSADLVVLGLNQAGTVAGGAALKAALSAASGGIVGAKANLNKDLFFDRAVPAILAQMSAARANQLAIIQGSLKASDLVYPLPVALMDVNAYREAGSIPTAINLLAANASDAKTDAKFIQTLARTGASAPQARGLAAARSAAGLPEATLNAWPPDRSFYRNLP